MFSHILLLYSIFLDIPSVEDGETAMSRNVYPMTRRHMTEEWVPHFVCYEFHSSESCQLSVCSLIISLTTITDWQFIFLVRFHFPILFMFCKYRRIWRRCQQSLLVLYLAVKLKKIDFVLFYVRFWNVWCVETATLNLIAVCVYAFRQVVPFSGKPTECKSSELLCYGLDGPVFASR